MKRVFGASAWTFVVLHVLALTLGLFGLLVAIPHPQIFAGDPAAMAFYAKAINNTGGTGMVLGAIAMVLFGFASYGPRRTIVFFLAATLISAAAELTGTKTGWPFGGYEYTSFLGYKMLGRVPFAIPLSWFYMGFASFALADAWDLVLDPSMAAPQMQYIHFWVWHESGPYFGMPLRNLVGWYATGLLFIAVGRLAWRERTSPFVTVTIPLVVYAANVIWSMVLSVSAGMWPTAIAAIALSLLPAALALPSVRVRKLASA
jgi:putative membrane protein